MIKLVVQQFRFALLLLIAVGAARAEVVVDMYSAQVAVADQSSAELARGSRLALSEVLVKVSGSQEVLSNPVIEAALSGARDSVQRYAYGESPTDPGGLVVKLLFDRAYITHLVIEAGAPIWTANRPAVLVWLVGEDADGRQFLHVDTAPDQISELRQDFARRGVPVQFPLYDLVDTAALSADQAWSLNDPALLQASTRYRLQDVLVGRLVRLSGAGVAGEWRYLHGDQAIQRSATAESEALFLRAGVALAAEAMAARYAVAASVNDGGLSMEVRGVTGYADYAAVVAWLESLELVEWANIESVRGDTITLLLKAQVDATQLASMIELNKSLVPRPLPAGGSGIQLNYQWQN